MILPFRKVRRVVEVRVLRRVAVLMSVLALGLALGGCSKCDWFKSDPRAEYQACK